MTNAANHGISKKLIPWQGNKALEARVWCPLCGKSKVVGAYNYSGWMEAHAGILMTTFCDHCPGKIQYVIREDGVEPRSG